MSRIFPTKYLKRIRIKEKSVPIKSSLKIEGKGKSEKQVENEICSWLFENNILFWKMKIKGDPFVVRGQIQFKKSLNCGFSDILICHKGLFICLEIKREKGGKASQNQIEMQKKVCSANGIYEFITSLQEVKNIFKNNNLI